MCGKKIYLIQNFIAMKKIFMFAVMFAAVSMVACGGQQKKAEATEECCGECATEQCCEGECAEKAECTEECCGECAEKAECAEECCGECAAEEAVEAEVVEVAE